MFGKACFCSILLIMSCLVLQGPVAAVDQPGFWYDGHRKVSLHAKHENAAFASGRGAFARGVREGVARYNNGDFYICYPSDWGDEQILDLETRYNLTQIRQRRHSPSIRIYQHSDVSQVLPLVNRIFEENSVDCAAPLWQKRVTTKSIQARYDPLFPQQWYLESQGQCGAMLDEDISAPEAWTLSLGEGVTIAIVDDGVALDHSDLVDNLLAAGHFDFVSSVFSSNIGDHGTAVAGVAAGRGFNNIGLMGVAPAASLLSLRILTEADQFVDEGDEAAALNYNGAWVDIYNNSWGPPDDSASAFEGPSMLVRSSMEAGTRQGRNGLGSIYVWAAGNGGTTSDSNLDGYANSRPVIAVAASNCSGMAASYAEPGSNILVNAPSSDGLIGMVATDKPGPYGYNTGSERGDLFDLDYTNTFGGTSGATAIVSGVVALMLAKNEYLNWRDVQQILAFSADRNDIQDGLWRANGAGFWVNEKYGYGRVNAEQAVKMADRRLDPTIDDHSIIYGKRVDRVIPDDDGRGLTDSITVNELLRIESVMVTVDIPEHSYWGDLSMYLTSPQGTQVRLVQNQYITPNALDLGYNLWTFKNVFHLGELSAGTWTIEVIDNVSGDTGLFRSWTLEVFGAPVPDQPDQLPLSCAAQSASKASTGEARSLFMGVNHHGSAYANTVSGFESEDYGVVAAVRAGVDVAEHLVVARYDHPNGSSFWYALADNGWQSWDGSLSTLQGFRNSSGVVKVVHAGKLPQGRYSLWNGYRNSFSEVFYCDIPVVIDVEE